MNVCIYLRKSRADRDHPEIPSEDVLKSHESILLAFAMKAGLSVADIKKEVVSGESLSRRPEMLKLLEEVEEGRYDAVLVKDFDRLGRGSLLEQGIIIEAFRRSGTKIMTPDKSYDLENEFDEEYIDISAFFARKELKMITKRLHSGRMKSVSDGNYISPHAPYGYDKVQKALVVNEKEKTVVKLIFDLYANRGYGDTKIARYLTDLGVPTKQGGTCWDKTTIRNLLRNPVYVGKITWNKREYRYLETGKRTSSFLNRAQWKIFEGRHEAIIDETLFEKAQFLAGKKSSPHIPAAKILRNPLSNLLKCGCCNKAMTIRTASGKENTLRCSGHCGSTMSSYLYTVEQRLISLLVLHWITSELSFAYLEPEKTGEESLARAHALESCEARKKRLHIQLNNIHDLLEQGVYDRVKFLDRLETVSENLKLAEEKAEDIKKKLSAGSPPEYNCQPTNRNEPEIITGNEALRQTDCSFAHDLRQFIQNVYWHLDPENKNALLRELIDSAVYYKPRGSSKDGFRLEIRLK